MKCLLAFVSISSFILIITFILTSCKVSSLISREEDNINVTVQTIYQQKK